MILDTISRQKLANRLNGFFKEATEKNRLCSLAAMSYWLNVPSDEIRFYPLDGKHAALINKARMRCENDIVNRMLAGTVDFRAAQMLLQGDFGYSQGGKSDKNKLNKVRKTIAAVLDEIEDKRAPTML